MTERVLVAPAAALAEAGLFQGFTDRVDHYLRALLRPSLLRFVPRDAAEGDPSLKQLIPYIVLRHEGRVFHYRRAGGGEARLRAKRSIGIGGHIAEVDGAAGVDAYHAGMRRELAEEVELPEILHERCVGLINDDATPVGQVHLGVVHVLDLASPAVRCKEAAMVAGGFAELGDLRRDREAFETWSRFLLDGTWLE